MNPTNLNTKEDIFNILRLLSSDEDLTQRDASMHLGFSLGKTNYLLKLLIKKDLIKIKNLISEGNKAKKVKYLLTKKGLKEKINLTYHFLQRKEAEYNSIKKEWNALVNRENAVSYTLAGTGGHSHPCGHRRANNANRMIWVNQKQVEDIEQ